MSATTLRRVAATDYHTAGEPFRIVTGGIPDIPGATVLDRREYATASEEVDFVRRLLCHEPRGHADMYGCFLVPPDDDGAELGALFWHKDGYSTACGHGTIALAEWLVRTGRVAAPDDEATDIVIDVPSGRVRARVHRRAGCTERVSFHNVPSYLVARDVPVRTSRGTVSVDVSYGGAMYASLPAASAGLTVTPQRYAELVAFGREVKWAVEATGVADHPGDARLSGVYGTILYDDLGAEPAGEPGPRQRNLVVFADGEADRSPCGSGTCARVALLAADGRLPDGHVLHHESIIGTRFTARIVDRASVSGREAVVPEVEGNAYPTGEHVFLLDPRDPIGAGFVLR